MACRCVILHVMHKLQCVLQEKLSKSLCGESRLDEEKSQLIERLNETENELSKTELLRRAVDTDNHRLKMMLQDKETQAQVPLPRLARHVFVK